LTDSIETLHQSKDTINLLRRISLEKIKQQITWVYCMQNTND